MEAGDEVNVTMLVDYGFVVKECGSHIVYEQEDENSSGKEVTPEAIHPLYQDVFDGDLSLYQRSKGKYVLSHSGLFPDLHPPQMQRPIYPWDDPTSYDASIYQPFYETDSGEDDNEEEEDDEDC